MLFWTLKRISYQHPHLQLSNGKSFVSESFSLYYSSADHESSDSEVESPSGVIRDYNDSDTDSLDLEPEMKEPVVSMVTSSVTSVTNTVSSVSSLLGSFLKKNESEPDLEDFEMISEDELSAESP